MKKLILFSLLLFSLTSAKLPSDSLYYQLSRLPQPIVVTYKYSPVSNYNPKAEMWVSAGGTYLKLISTPNIMILINKYTSGDTIKMDSVRVWMAN